MVGVSENCFCSQHIWEVGVLLVPTVLRACKSLFSENFKKLFPLASLCVFNLVFSVFSLWFFLQQVFNLQHIYNKSLYQHDTKVQFSHFLNQIPLINANPRCDSQPSLHSHLIYHESDLSWNFCRAFSFQTLLLHDYFA